MEPTSTIVVNENGTLIKQFVDCCSDWKIFFLVSTCAAPHENMLFIYLVDGTTILPNLNNCIQKNDFVKYCSSLIIKTNDALRKINPTCPKEFRRRLAICLYLLSIGDKKELSNNFNPKQIGFEVDPHVLSKEQFHEGMKLFFWHHFADDKSTITIDDATINDIVTKNLNNSIKYTSFSGKTHKEKVYNSLLHNTTKSPKYSLLSTSDIFELKFIAYSCQSDDEIYSDRLLYYVRIFNNSNQAVVLEHFANCNDNFVIQHLFELLKNTCDNTFVPFNFAKNDFIVNIVKCFLLF